MSFLKLRGVFPPMITPFTEQGELDLVAHKENVEKWNNTGLAGYLVLGSNSEAVYLTEAEKLDLIKATKEVAAEDKLIIVGTGMESTRETIALTNKAADLGADCALLLTPNYYGGQMGDEAQLAYFTEVADQVKIPIMIYNVTKFTHVNISPNVVGKLSKHPNIIGMKDSSGSVPQLIQFKQVVDFNEFNLLVGTASAWYPALDLGIEASIMALANCSPNECVKVQALYDEGKVKESKELFEKMFPVNDAVTAKYGVPGLKYACKELGFNGGFVRSPMQELTDEKKEQIDQILKRAGLI